MAKPKPTSKVPADRQRGLRKGHRPSPPEIEKAAARGAALAPGQIQIPKGEPVLTLDKARELAKLLTAGLPQTLALAYMEPEYYKTANKWQKRPWLTRWLEDPKLLDALSALNGGRWQDLEPKRRLEVALDKHYAELAHFIYTRAYASMYGEDRIKATEARQALVEKVTADKGMGGETPWQTFMRDLLAGKVGKAALPPQLQPDSPASPSVVPTPKES